MITTPPAVTIPLHTDEHGVIRIGTSRVTLDSVIYAFRGGATPETIVEKYPTLSLTDVYLVTGYYLHNRAEVDNYLREQEAASENRRRQIETDFPADGLRARLLAKLAAKHTS